MTFQLISTVVMILAGMVSVLAIIKAIKSDKKSIQAEQKAKDNQETLITLAENDMHHINSAIKEIKENNKDIWKAINELKRDNKDEIDRIGKLEGRMNHG